MENASKALIIAGAILLAILIISLGIMIFTQAQDTIGNSGMSKAEIQSFNSQFTKYEGDKKGSEVKAMIQEVNTSNAADVQEGNDRQITITGTGITASSSDGKTKAKTYSTSNIASTKKYNISISYDDNSGYVSTITIK